MDGRMDRWMDGCTCVWIGRRMDGWTHRRVDEWVGRWAAFCFQEGRLCCVHIKSKQQSGFSTSSFWKDVDRLSDVHTDPASHSCLLLRPLMSSVAWEPAYHVFRIMLSPQGRGYKEIWW